MKENKTIVAFHCGRGGRFNNAGYVTFIGNKLIGEFTDDLFCRFENEMDFKDRYGFDNTNDKNQRCVLDLIGDGDFDELYEKFGIAKEQLGEEMYFDGGGNSVGLSQKDVDSGVGLINIDNEYDKTACQFLQECDEDDLLKILVSNEWNKIDLIQEYFDECTDLVIDWSNFNGDYRRLIESYFSGFDWYIDDFYINEKDDEN